MQVNKKKSIGASKEAIQLHYDIGNDFYKLFLDESMTYSCGLWEEGDNLKTAQERKMRYHLAEINAMNKKSILDIGCGWGALMQKAKRDFNVQKVDGLTLSQEQLDMILKHSQPCIRVYLQSWDDFEPDQLYEGIISVGAFEHFAHLNMSKMDRIERYRSFFLKCHEWTRPGAIISLQTIGCGNMLRSDFSDFFAQRIFPESDLPRLGEIFEAAECLFEVKKLRNDRPMYGKTVREWLRQLMQNKEKAIDLTNKATYDLFVKYFKLVIISFETQKSMNLYRITFKRIDKPRSLTLVS